MTSDKPDSYLKIGEHIGPLEILEFVGEGQFSRVYRARHRAKARNFILKQFRPNDRLGPLTAEQQDWLLQAFEKEAEITKALRHPNIQACLGRVSNQVGDFLLFPDCMGEPLHRHLAQIHFDGHIPLSRFCDLGAQLLETLAFLRKQRVCHGDIKAENLILSQDGQIKLIDFGAAALASLSGSPVKMMTLSSEGSSRLSKSGGPSHEQDTYQVLELLFYLLTGHKATGENLKQAVTGAGANSAPREQILTLICHSLSANWQQVLTNVSDLTACLQRLKTENQAPSLDEAPTQLLPITAQHERARPYESVAKRHTPVWALALSIMMIWLFRAELSWFWHETESKPASEALAPQKSVSAKTTSGVDSIDTQVNHAETQIDSSKVAVRTKPSHLAESAVAPINVPKARTSELADNILSGNKLDSGLPKPLPEIVTRLVDSMVAVPNGEFRLGSHYGRQNETPVISITVPGFSISSREATWDLVNACIRAEACDGQMQDKSAYLVPVTRIRFDTIKYQLLPWLNSLSDHSFALPSEVQWEYAAKAGSQADYYWGDEFKFDMANCTGCGANGGRMALAPVAQFAANPFGLFDMLGNAAEMVDTCWRERHDPGEAMLIGAAMACENIVVRGGGFSDQVSDIRTSSRQAFSTKRKSSAIGFRLIMLPTSNQN